MSASMSSKLREKKHSVVERTRFLTWVQLTFSSEPRFNPPMDVEWMWVESIQIIIWLGGVHT